MILWLQQQKGRSVERVEQFLYHDCGLRGLSGVERVLLASKPPLAALAVEHFVYHITQTVGALAASMGGIDGLVFTAGIGEHSPPLRAKVLRRLACRVSNWTRPRASGARVASPAWGRAGRPLSSRPMRNG
jgi:acetate kinase